MNPEAPAYARCEQLLDILASLVAHGGAARLLAAPVVPSPRAFPEPWRATATGVELLLRRLAWHAGLAGDVVVIDDAIGAPPTERRPATRVELENVRGGRLVFRIGFLGRDDVAGALAHEVGVACDQLQRAHDDNPYRAPAAAPVADGDAPVLELDERDLERGSVAAVYAGLGVLAINAAFQQYSSGRWNGAYNALEYDVVQAGYVPMQDLAYLLAVQAVVRAAPGKAEVPAKLLAGQADEVTAWLGTLRDRRSELRARLGIAADAGPDPEREVVPFRDPGEPESAAPPRMAWKQRTNRAGSGFLVGSVLGVALASFAPVHGLMLPVSLLTSSMGAGYALGRRTRVLRCSRCRTSVSPELGTCRGCRSLLRGEVPSAPDDGSPEDEDTSADVSTGETDSGS